MTHALIEFGNRGMHGGRGGAHPFLFLCGLVIIGAVIGLIVWAFRSRSASKAVASSTAAPAPSATAGAETILAERLARGEVSPEDYKVLLATLRGEDVPAPTA
ncbi:MAG: hypothetical protein ACOYMR_00370 [Ilumatobacteraceae bacterium]